MSLQKSASENLQIKEHGIHFIWESNQRRQSHMTNSLFLCNGISHDALKRLEHAARPLMIEDGSL